ncbi:MAG: uroporphyrinogen-III C-methyltransferase [Aquificae bacterium]|nr:uroporphyrinogen-III C-methyltransferase [Aquificota bacterium]
MGKVYLVGAGPGDPELLTLKAVKVLHEADVVLYDRLISEEALHYTKPACKLVYVGKSDGKHTIPQEEINRLLVYYASTHEVVVRLKGGDPFVFGRGGEEALYLKRHGIPYEIVPGVSSLYSVPAYAGIPLTFRGIASSFAVITGHEATGKEKRVNWLAFREIDTLVILMGVRNRQRIAKELIASGRNPDEPVAFVERGTTPQQRVTVSTLKEVATEPPPVNPPAIMVVGEVVRLQKELSELLTNLKAEEVYHAR